MATEKNVEKMKDCFAYNHPTCHEECAALKDGVCNGKCAFYKSAAQERKELFDMCGVWTVDDACEYYSRAKNARAMA